MQYLELYTVWVVIEGVVCTSGPCLGLCLKAYVEHFAGECCFGGKLTPDNYFVSVMKK